MYTNPFIIEIKKIQEELFVHALNDDDFTREVSIAVRKTRGVNKKYEKIYLCNLLDFYYRRNRVFVDKYENHIDTNPLRKKQFVDRLFALV